MRSCPISAPRRASERRELLGRRMRAREQRVLQHAARRRIDDDGDAIDRRRRADAIRDRAARASAASARRASATAAPAAARAPRRVDAGRAAATCSTAAPRSRRSSRVDSGSSSRVSTNDSGSSPSIGHSSSSDDSKRSSGSVGHERPRCPRRARSPATPARAARAATARSAGGSAASSPKRPDPPTFEPQRSQSSQSLMVLIDSLAARLRRALRLTVCSRMPIGSGASAAASLAGFDDRRRPGARARGRARPMRVAGDRDVRAHAARGRLARAARRRSSRGGPSSRSSPLTSIDDEIVAVPLVARRELLRDGDERATRDPPQAAVDRTTADDRQARVRARVHRDQGIERRLRRRSRIGDRGR